MFSFQAKTHMRSISAVVGISLLLLSAARAQEQAGFTHCQSITANDERLSCYDKLSGLGQQAGPKLPDQGYQATSLTDVKLDQDALRGRRVEVSGNLVVGSDIAFLLSGNADTSPLIVDFKAVSREQRRTMLERCGASGCPVTIRGRVDRVMAQPGIVADNVEVH